MIASRHFLPSEAVGPFLDIPDAGRVINLSRRGFVAGAAGLVLAIGLPGRRALAQSAGPVPVTTPVVFVKIATDDTVTVLSKHTELGQGAYTGLTALVAEELDADWSLMRADAAPSESRYYANLFFGAQATGSSTGLANSYMQMRMVGATARAMLVAAAAAKWGVPAAEIAVKRGRITHAATKNEAGFGEFASAAASLDLPAAPKLKGPADFTLIGRELPRLDTAAKSRGSAKYGLDLHREGMLTVVVARPRKLGAVVKSFDAKDAAAIPGVEMVREIPTGVAVYAKNTWSAMKGRNSLHIEWDESEVETRSTEELFEEYSKAAEGGVAVEVEGDTAASLKEAATVVEAEYRFPYLAQTPMEPLNGVIEINNGAAVMWYGCQSPSVDQATAAKILGIPIENVTINVMLAGGSFGRRFQGDSELAAEIASVAKAGGGDGSFKLVRTREDDLRGGYYRPLTVHRFRAGLDAKGNIVAWENTIANQSIFAGTVYEPLMKNGVEPVAFDGSAELPYRFGSRKISWARSYAKIPVSFWRSVGNSHTCYAVETFIDQLLREVRKDPVAGRLELLKPEAIRERGVIERVAQMSGWKGSTQADRPNKAYGIAWVKAFGTFVAQVAEVENQNGQPKVTKVWCAVDCGVPVNPNIIRAQMEGSIGFGLSTALYSEINLRDGGEIAESNWDQYRILRINEMPDIEVSIIQSTEAPTGVGEPGVPPIGPAVANAWRALTGTSVRQLPFARASV